MSILETNSWLFGVPSALRQQQLRNPQGLELVELVPGLLLNRSGVSMRHERGQKNRDTILTTWFVIKWWWKKLDVSSPFFGIWSKVNWMPTDCAVNSSGSYLTLTWDRYENSPTGQPVNRVNRVNGQVGYHPGLSELVSGSSANNLFGESFWMLISVPIGLMYLGPNLEDFFKKAISIGKSR